jgi:hypothetical protein
MDGLFVELLATSLSSFAVSHRLSPPAHALQGSCSVSRPLVRIENPESSDCSLAPLEENYLCFSQETTILRRIRF